MEATPPKGNGKIKFDPNKKHSLGQRAFLLFLVQRIHWVLFFFAFTFAFWYAQRWVPAVYLPWSEYGVELLLMLGIAFFLLVFLRTYFEYRYYTYFFTDEAFVMTYGYIVRNEIATLYHHIQNVNIERSMFDRSIGVSKIIILMTGSDRNIQRNQIILPAVGKTKAKFVQAELLKRARRHAMMAEDED